MEAPFVAVRGRSTFCREAFVQSLKGIQRERVLSRGQFPTLCCIERIRSSIDVNVSYPQLWMGIKWQMCAVENAGLLTRN